MAIPELEDDEVHVWCACLDQPAPGIEALQGVLAADELARAQQFRRAEDQARYTVARGFLRTILGHYLNREPLLLTFSYGRHGKPELAGECATSALRFNVTHADNLALYVVTRGREIGIDLEHIRGETDAMPLAERFFSPREVGALHALPAHLQLYAFYRCWTRKEAYVKATGEGITLPLDRFDVSLAPGEPPTLLAVRDAPDEVERWSLHDLYPAPGYAAALAVEGMGRRLRCWQWPPASGPAGRGGPACRTRRVSARRK